MEKVKNTRRDKINYYLDIAESVTERSTCLRRHWGAVIVNNDEIISTGYNLREKLNIPRGERYELCRSVHAEQNAIISAARKDIIGATLFMVGKDAKTGNYVEKSNSCAMCKRVIINAGIKDIYIRDNKNEYRHIDVEKEFIENDDSLDGTKGY